MTKDDKFKKKRESLVESLRERGQIDSDDVEKAMMKVKREEFVLPRYKDNAYSDNPLPIPSGVTISAPHMHAMILSEIGLDEGDRVLEIGAGSGILLAYMYEIVGDKGEVMGVEIIPEVYRFAKNNLEKTGYVDKVEIVPGDFTKALGRKKFDKIVISATCPKIPDVLVENLKSGGKLIAPVGIPGGKQELIVVKRSKDGPLMKSLGHVMFVPLEGEYGWD